MASRPNFSLRNIANHNHALIVYTDDGTVTKGLLSHGGQNQHHSFINVSSSTGHPQEQGEERQCSGAYEDVTSSLDTEKEATVTHAHRRVASRRDSQLVHTCSHSLRFNDLPNEKGNMEWEVQTCGM